MSVGNGNMLGNMLAHINADDGRKMRNTAMCNTVVTILMLTIQPGNISQYGCNTDTDGVRQTRNTSMVISVGMLVVMLH